MFNSSSCNTTMYNVCLTVRQVLGVRIQLNCATRLPISICVRIEMEKKILFNNQNLLTKAIIYNNYLPIMPKVTSIEKFIELSTELLANYPTTTTLSTTYTNVSKNLKNQLLNQQPHPNQNQTKFQLML